jgi:hypothetical protein
MKYLLLLPLLIGCTKSTIEPIKDIKRDTVVRFDINNITVPIDASRISAVYLDTAGAKPGYMVRLVMTGNVPVRAGVFINVAGLYKTTSPVISYQGWDGVKYSFNLNYH